jgi:hypothetical protein
MYLAQGIIGVAYFAVTGAESSGSPIRELGPDTVLITGL